MNRPSALVSRFRHPLITSPFDAGRLVAVGRTEIGFVLATVDDPARPALLHRHWVGRDEAHAVATGITSAPIDPTLAATRGLGWRGYEVGWLIPRPAGVELGRINFDGEEEREWIELSGVDDVGAGWIGETPLVCGVRADGSVGCLLLADALPAEEARQLDGTGLTVLGPGAAGCETGSLDGSGEANDGSVPSPCEWVAVGTPRVLGGDDAAVVVVLARRGDQTRALARVIGADGAPRGPAVDLAGEAWTPRNAAWSSQVQALVIGDELAWVLPSGEGALARAGRADLVTGQSTRLQVEPLASMRERPLLLASHGAALFVYDAVGREGERTMVRWRDGAPLRLEGLTPLGSGSEGRTARLAASGDGVVAVVVDDGQGGAEVVLLDADGFTRGPDAQ